MDVPELTDGVVTLRAHHHGDVADLVAMGSDVETVRWTSVPVPYDERHARRWIDDTVPAGWRAGTVHGWAVEALDGATPRFAGNVDLRLGPPPDIGYATAPWARGRGLTARAVRLATRWGFERAGLPVVHWSTHADNLASWRVAHACGFAFHGERPLSLPARGELRDGWFASLQPGDPQTPSTTWWPTPVLDGERVRLRPFADTDVARIVESRDDPTSRRWLTTVSPYTADTARRFVRRARLQAATGQRVSWAVVDPADDLLFGDITVFRLDGPIDPTGGEIGYCAHPDARGRGLMREALALVRDHAFTPLAGGGLGRNRLQIGTAWTNTASRALAESAGFTLVAHLHRDGVIGEGDEQVVDDGAWYELLRPREW